MIVGRAMVMTTLSRTVMYMPSRATTITMFRAALLVVGACGEWIPVFICFLPRYPPGPGCTDQRSVRKVFNHLQLMWVVMSERIVELLKTHGFSEYEAKAYTAVVGLGRGTAREICEISGVPQGRIYTVLHSLSDRGFVEVEAGSPTFYLAEDPAELFIALKEEYCESIDVLVGELKSLHVEAHLPSPIWSIRNERGIRHRLRMLIRDAGEDIIMIARDSGALQAIADDLRAANRRVNLTVLVPDRAPFAGIGLRVFPMSVALLNLFREMLEKKPGMKDPTWATELFMIVDGVSAIVVGRRAGVRSATVFCMPAVCFMIRRLIELLEPAVRGEEDRGTEKIGSGCEPPAMTP